MLKNVMFGYSSLQIFPGDKLYGTCFPISCELRAAFDLGCSNHSGREEEEQGKGAGNYRFWARQQGQVILEGKLLQTLPSGADTVFFQVMSKASETLRN